jgi:MraZ protein
VARRFIGESTQKMDAKGRVSVPHFFRPVIQAGDPDWSDGKAPQLIIVYGLEDQNYLEAFTITAADELDDKIDALPEGSEARELLETVYRGHALYASVDETGRLVLPQRLREKLDLTDEVYFISAGKTFYMWKPETYAAEKAPRTTELARSLPKGYNLRRLLNEPMPGAEE